MKTIKKVSLIIIALAAIPFFAAGCGHSKPNDLKRPIGENETENSQSNEQADTAAANEETGMVAGDTTPLPEKNITVGSETISVEVADTDASRTQGLSGREKLQTGTGMLFDFTNTDYTRPGFWMKDMLISIDMIWIRDGKIIGITKDVPLPPQDADLPVYYPPSEITHVLEVPAGWSAQNNIMTGDSVRL